MESSPPEAPSGRLRFGDLEFDRRTLELWREGEPVRLALLPARLLALLAERPGELVSREVIKQALWGETFVQHDASLNYCVNQLRAALQDDAERPRYIETLRGRGYRLVAPLAPEAAPAADGRGRSRRLVAAAALVVMAAGGGLIGHAVGGAPAVAPVPGRQLPQDRDARRREAVRRGTSSLEAFDDYLRGRRHYQSYRADDNERAIVLYQRALQRDPSFTLARAELANALAQRFRMREASRDAAVAAERTAREAVARKPDLPEAHKALGLALTVQGRLGPALECYRRAAELRPAYPEALFNAGLVEYNRGHLGGALYWQRRLAALVPGVVPAWAMAQTLWDLGLTEQARQWVDAVLAKEPSHLEAQALLSAWALRSGHPDEAERLAQHLVSIYPDDPRSWVTLGNAQRVAGRLEPAIRSFSTALGRSPQADGPAALRLAEALFAAGRHAEATERSTRFEALCRESLQAGRDDWWCPWSQAVLLAARGDRPGALAALGRAVDAGHRDWRWDQVEPAFGGLRRDPAFDRILARMREDVDAMRREASTTPLPPPPA